MIAVVLAYKRPELVIGLVNRILEIGGLASEHGTSIFERVFLVHDGLRSSESIEDVKSYQQVRALCIELEKSDNRISIIHFEDNVGLTSHTFRTISALELPLRNCIFFEEDKAPNREGIEFLLTQSKGMDSCGYLDTLPIRVHSQRIGASLSTIFTDNGNHIYGESLIEIAREIFQVGDRFQLEFEKNLFEYFSSYLSGYSLGRAFRYYRDYFSWGLFNRDRPDSLFAYTLILNKKLKTCPISPQAENWSDRDTRGLNMNRVPKNRDLQCEGGSNLIWDVNICPDCERQGTSERVSLTFLDSLKNSAKWRLRKIRTR